MNKIFARLEFKEEKFQDIIVRLQGYLNAEHKPGWVPIYKFDIYNDANVQVGRIEFRAGETEALRCIDGHIGYHIDEEYRGNKYAFKACKAIIPFINRHNINSLYLTTDFENIASNKTIRAIGAELSSKNMAAGKYIYLLNLAPGILSE